jgi:hypothetical protein
MTARTLRFHVPSLRGAGDTVNKAALGVKSPDIPMLRIRTFVFEN